MLLDVFAIFFLFLLFVGYEIWCVVFHGMKTPRSKVGGGSLFLDLLWLCDEDEARLLNGGRMHLVKGGDIYLTRIRS